MLSTMKWFCLLGFWHNHKNKDSLKMYLERMHDKLIFHGFRFFPPLVECDVDLNCQSISTLHFMCIVQWFKSKPINYRKLIPKLKSSLVRVNGKDTMKTQLDSIGFNIELPEVTSFICRIRFYLTNAFSHKKWLSNKLRGIWWVRKINDYRF